MAARIKGEAMKIVFVMVALMSASAANASDWRVAAVSKDGSRIVFVDAETIKRSGSTVTYWADIRRREITDGENGYLTLERTDCANMTNVILQMSVRLDDTTIRSWTGGFEQKYITPDSIGWGNANCVCSQDYLSDRILDKTGYTRRYFKSDEWRYVD